jgi:FkbM family methyltransferase
MSNLASTYMTDSGKVYFEQDQAKLKQLQGLGLKPKHFFDVGASNACWTTVMSACFPEATFDMFEPLADLAPSYQQGMEWHLAHHPRSRLHKVAIGEKRGLVKMHIDASDPVNSTAVNMKTPAPTFSPREVEMTTLDDAVRDFGLAIPQVIKVDIQGGELNVLKGARWLLPQVDVLLLECWLRRGYSQDTPLLLEVANWLRDFDFHLWDLGDCYRDSGTLVHQDCFFLNARSAISRLRDEPRHLHLASDEAASHKATRGWRGKIRSLVSRGRT